MSDNYPEEETRLKASLNQEQPSKELLEWAKDNINEDPDKRDQIISDLRDLIFEKGECTPHRIDDDYLLRFLRARHFIVRKAHRLMVNYYDFKESTPEYFQNIDVYQMKKLAKTMIMSAPPYRDQNGRRMMILKLGNWNPSEFTIPELFQLAVGILEISLMEPQCQIKGCILIVDLSDLGLNKAWYMTPTLAKHLINLTITSFPMRLEAVHFLHSSWVFDVAWSMFKPLIAESAKDRILFHGDDMESLHNYIDTKHLPKSYGGIQMEYPLDIWFEDVIEKDNNVIDELVKLGYEGMNLLKKEEKA